MQEKSLYEYAVLRYVPQVDREEFINIGVVLYCRDRKFLAMRYHLDEARIRSFDLDVDLPLIHDWLEGFDDLCRGATEKSEIATLERAERFRWLTAHRSTILQTSRVHPGLCHNPEQTLAHLFQSLVLI